MKDWVQLFCGRFQGRKRVGLKKLLGLKAKEITRHNLQVGEVLALHIYTGVCASILHSAPANFSLNFKVTQH